MMGALGAIAAEPGEKCLTVLLFFLKVGSIYGKKLSLWVECKASSERLLDAAKIRSSLHNFVAFKHQIFPIEDLRCHVPRFGSLACCEQQGNPPHVLCQLCAFVRVLHSCPACKLPRKDQSWVTRTLGCGEDSYCLKRLWKVLGGVEEFYYYFPVCALPETDAAVVFL